MAESNPSPAWTPTRSSSTPSTAPSVKGLGLPRVPPPKTLWDACLRILEAPPSPEDDRADVLARVRARLMAAGVVLAIQRKEDPHQWSAYAEKHLAGVRFMLRDASGREVDLQTIPGTAEELATWLPPSPNPPRLRRR